MRRLLLSTTALLALGAASHAADFTPFEPAPVVAAAPTAYDWTGPYVGLNAGYMWADSYLF